ncbi:hypothetical protein C7H62_0525 [Mesoflavibacter sp. HG96]|uniref:DUF4178 domain-containing protein n=1 Tax=Mesoflavibacter profundi TaxID=2708110 RepID=A0ABT4RZZ2_9FLAO|nr:MULTISPECIES: hypothetical protein [Mesoflavibacter]MDA0177382.1 hypothetical protein [Mesoflavibacter profundi]QIJ88334.1 hypothetical protein C7H62_0525 [Mesoflavibacter sp. HG96]QIJ91062.1 hypothetical protein C7H56_0525 [Mesoflavibacter sp. HG37]
MLKWLNRIFKNIQKPNLEGLEYLIFGRFFSDNYGAYEIYKLTRSELLVDKREIWHIERYTKNGYTFVGELLSQEKFELVKDLIVQVPNEILDKNLNGFYTTGNKNEDKLIVEISDGIIKKEITIDDYEFETENLPTELRKFRLSIERKIKELD